MKPFDIKDVVNPPFMRHMLPGHTHIHGRGFVPNWILETQRIINPPMMTPPGFVPYQPPRMQTPGY